MCVKTTLFTSVEEHNFQKKIDQLRKKYKRMEDVHRGITWALAKNPYCGTPIKINGPFMVLKTTTIGNTPSFWVLYKIDIAKEEIHLISIEPVELE